MDKAKSPKCSQENPTFIRYWTDEGFSDAKMKSGLDIYGSISFRDMKSPPNWHCTICHYDWCVSNKNNGIVRENYIEDNFLISPR